MAKKSANLQEYTADQIEKLADLDAIRKLAGMYVGNKGAHGLNHILFEVVDNAVDEAMAGFGSTIKVAIAKDGTVTVTDNGRGIPVEWKSDAGLSALTQLFTQRHTGGKFGGGAYSSSGGLHGIGIKATNAFSSRLEVEVRRYGLKFRQRFENGGEPATPVEIIEKGGRRAGVIDAHTSFKIGRNGLAEALIVKGKPQKVAVTAELGTGTEVSFRPNRAYFSREMEWPTPEKNVPWEVERVANRLRQISYLYPGIKLTLVDERDGKKQIFESEKGLIDYLTYLNEGHEPLHKPIYFEAKSQIDDSDNETGKAQVKVEVVMQYAGEETEIHAFTNAIPNPLGGTHVKGFKAALTKAVKSFATNKKLIKGDDDFKGDDALLGLTAILSITMGKTPQFSSQTKEELTSPEINGPVLSATYDFLSDYLEKNIPVGKIIVSQAVAAARGREAAAQARQLVIKRSALDAGEYVLGKLADIQRRSGAPTVPLEHTALYLVEGDSAGGSCKMGRDSRYHAILPLRGKIPNIEKKVQLNKLLTNREIASIVAAIGGGVAADFNIDTMRYGRVSLLSVRGEEFVVVRDPAGQIHPMPIGQFVDRALAEGWDADRLAQWQVASFSLQSHQTRYAPIKAVIRHEHSKPMYRIQTVLGRSITATGHHSIFVYENGQIALKPTSDIKPGDYVVAPRRMPAAETRNTTINVMRELYRRGKTLGLSARGPDVRQATVARFQASLMESHTISGRRRWLEARIRLDSRDWERLRTRRLEKGLTQRQVAEAIGLREAISVCHYEKGKNMPPVSMFEAYVDAIDARGLELPSRTVEESRLAEISRPTGSKHDHYRSAGDYRPLNWFRPEEMDRLNGTTVLVPRAHHDAAFSPYGQVTADLAYFLGWYLAEGSLGGHGQVRLALGSSDLENYDVRLKHAIQTSFGIAPKISHDHRYESGITLYIHSVRARALIQALGLDQRAWQKSIPDQVFNWPADFQQAFVEGYLAGDGHVDGRGCHFTTTSERLANGLRYLLLQLGVETGCSVTDPHLNHPGGLSRRRQYHLTVAGKDNLTAFRPVWQGHKNAAQVEALLGRPGYKSPPGRVYISEDLMAVEVVQAEALPAETLDVYDLSVETDENFICGNGGLCAHNTDADDDGYHIATLLVTLFWKIMRPMVDQGRLFIARPPLFQIKRGSDSRYVYTKPELPDVVEEWGGPDKVTVQRYKGLGEMNPEQLRETVFVLPEAVRGKNGHSETPLTLEDFASRDWRVTAEDAHDVNSLIEKLMGSDVSRRKEWLVGLDWDEED
jgi:DNA gyrase subunit B